MERGGELSLNVKEVVKQGPELRHKNRSVVTNDGVWKTIILYNHVNNHFRQFWSINGDFDWFVIYHLGQTVDNDWN